MLEKMERPLTKPFCEGRMIQFSAACSLFFFEAVLSFIITFLQHLYMMSILVVQLVI
jgi:hypothetical protein